jgi:hyperosmotically inducible periplasmic protein
MKLIKTQAVLCATLALVMSGSVLAQASDAMTAAPAATSAHAGNHQLTRAVQRAFAKTKGLNSTHIAVRAHNGEVSLSGTVPDTDQIDKATHVAQGVAGVSSVRNLLSVHEEGH